MPPTEAPTLPAIVAGEPAPAEPEVNWDAFDSHAYWKKNYTALRGDDRLFLRKLRGFFGDLSASARPRTGTWRGVDVGTGTNLYPALAMLPLCDEIELWEHGQQNYDWLRREVPSCSTLWDPFWRELRGHPEYAQIASARRRLAKTARVVRGNLFDLRAGRYDVGTMFFVAESITDRPEEFESAVRAFIRSLRSRAPFAAAFMRNSAGYQVGDRDFPALRIDVPEIEACLRDVADVAELETVDTHGHTLGRPLRTGYDGMILVLGHTK